MEKIRGSRACAPVLLFVYNRLEHTKKTVEALQKNYLVELTDLYVFSDAPKRENVEKDVMAVRDYIKNGMNHGAFKSVKIIEQETNKGLADSIIDGITETINIYGKVIVLEDDLISSPYFLTYMNDGLERYQNADNVYSVCGYSYFAEKGYLIDKLLIPDYYFLQYHNSWGWGTWKEKWKYFDPLATGWEEIKVNSDMQKKFSLNCLRPDVSLLIQQMEQGIDSWALRWWWSIFKNDGIVLFPNRTLIQNIGWDGSGVHGAGGDPNKKVVLAKKFTGKMPGKAIEKQWIRRQLINAWKPSIPRRVVNKLRRILHGGK